MGLEMVGKRNGLEDKLVLGARVSACSTIRSSLCALVRECDISGVDTADRFHNRPNYTD